MKTISSVRRDIEKIDKKIKKLFIERMNCSKIMGELKKEEGLPIENIEREEYLKRKYSKDIVEYRKEYLSLLDKIFSLSKEEMNKN